MKFIVEYNILDIMKKIKEENKELSYNKLKDLLLNNNSHLRIEIEGENICHYGIEILLTTIIKDKLIIILSNDKKSIDDISKNFNSFYKFFKFNVMVSIDNVIDYYNVIYRINEKDYNNEYNESYLFFGSNIKKFNLLRRIKFFIDLL